MKKNGLLVLIVLAMPLMVFSQPRELYQVRTETLNMRSGPGTNFNVVYQLDHGDKLSVISKENGTWWTVDHYGVNGFVHSDYLMPYLDEYAEWTKKDYSSGTTPECYNIIPKYDFELDNMLKVDVGSNTDVVVKMMRQEKYGQDLCIRIAYIRGGDTYKIKNIPEGMYYLKIAYGKDWRQTIENDQCKGKFVYRAEYERGEDIMDYYLKDRGDYYDVPSYELFLDIVWTEEHTNNFDTNEISESEFNK